jgi:peptidoglycan/LPS O-acetylase OafA/YrhL
LFGWIVFGLLYLPSFGALVPYPLLGPAWSLTCELVANIVYGYLYRYLSNRLVAAIVALFAIGLVFATIRVGSLNEIGHWWSIWVGFVRVFFSFFVGVLVYRLRNRIPRKFARIPTELLLIAFTLYLFIPSTYSAIRDLVFIGAVSPFLVAAGSVSQARYTASNAVMTFLGDASYPVYALHWPFSLRLHALALVGYGSAISTVILFTVGTAVAGYLADRFLDRPIRRYLTDRFIPKRDRPNSELRLA